MQTIWEKSKMVKRGRGEQTRRQRVGTVLKASSPPTWTDGRIEDLSNSSIPCCGSGVDVGLHFVFILSSNAIIQPTGCYVLANEEWGLLCLPFYFLPLAPTDTSCCVPFSIKPTLGAPTYMPHYYATQLEVLGEAWLTTSNTAGCVASPHSHS